MDEEQRAVLEAAIEDYLATKGQSTLRGRFFDVGHPDGRRAYAEWLAGEIDNVLGHMESLV